jgi:hypothetical protein
MKSIWTERAQTLTSYAKFWKRIQRTHWRHRQRVVPAHDQPGRAQPAPPTFADRIITLNEVFKEAGISAHGTIEPSSPQVTV